MAETQTGAAEAVPDTTADTGEVAGQLLDADAVETIREAAHAAIARVERDTQIHFTGELVTLTDTEGTRQRQRCAWCGVLLLDVDDHRLAVPDGQPGERHAWPAGRLLAADAGVFVLVDYDPGADVPPGTCAARDAEAGA